MDSFHKNILQFNSQLTVKGLAPERLQALKGFRADGVVIAGMGGSGLAGEILSAARKEVGLRVPLVISKNYGLPATPFKRPLFIAVSFSGNTKETISSLNTFLKKKQGKAAVITTGGALTRIAEQKRLPLVAFPASDLTPRQAIGRMFYGLTEVLHVASLISRFAPEFTALNPLRAKGQGTALARDLEGHLPLIYTDEAERHIGYIWKIKFNETSKTLAFNNVLPEADHNEIVGFEKNNFKTAAIFLHSNRISKHVRKNFKVTEDLLKKQGVKVMPVRLEGRTMLEATWRAIILADWTTYFLAKLNLVDPAATEIIEGKGGLKERI